MLCSKVRCACIYSCTHQYIPSNFVRDYERVVDAGPGASRASRLWCQNFVVRFAGSSTRVGKITYEGDVGKYQLPQTVFAKFALPADNTFRSFFAGAGMYKREIVCYNQLLPASPTAHPQFFFAEYDDTTHDFALVLRDMSDRMYCRDVPAC
jgi:hypothetical protein